MNVYIIEDYENLIIIIKFLEDCIIKGCCI